jgi:hypothetical protein
MTTADPRDREAPSDPRVDAAWRALSDERPPDSLDAAIMAAARREVGAKPRKIATREAVADRRRWWPLAAAATIAAIAVGVLQLTTPDQMGAPASDRSVVTDVPTPATTSAPEVPTTRSRPDEMKPEAGSAPRAEEAPTRVDSPRRQGSAPEPRQPADRESSAGNAPAMAEPFPAAPTQPGVDAPTAAAAPGRIAATAPSSPPGAGGRIATPASPTHPSAAEQIAMPAPPPPPAAAGFSQRVQESAAAPPNPLAKMAAGRAADAGADEARAKDRAPLPVADWIALIRRLRDGGKSADAAKELAAFRVAHADHEKLLPSDLRDWRPPEK